MASLRSPRGWATVGAFVVVVSLVAGAGLWLGGTESHLGSSPALQAVDLRNETATNLCEVLTEADNCAADQSSDATGIAYIATGNLDIVPIDGLANGGAILELEGDTLAPVAQVSTPCGGLEGPVYPGIGGYVFFTCYGGGYTSMLVFNWSSATIVGVVHLGPVPEWLDFAYDLGHNIVYASAALLGGAGFLMTVNITDDRVVANVSLPTQGLPLIWTNGSGGAVVVAGTESSAIYVVDPASGSIAQTIPLSGTIVDVGFGSPAGEFLLYVAPAGTTGSSDMITFGTGPVRELSSTEAPWSAGEGDPIAVVDRSHGDLYVQWSGEFPPGEVYAFNESSGDLAGSLPDTTRYPLLTAGGTYVPGSDTVVLAGMFANQSGNNFAGLTAIDLLHGSAPQPAYSGIPWIGTNLPLYVAGAGAAVGGILILTGILRRRSPDPPTVHI